MKNNRYENFYPLMSVTVGFTPKAKHWSQPPITKLAAKIPFWYVIARLFPGVHLLLDPTQCEISNPIVSENPRQLKFHITLSVPAFKVTGTHYWQFCTMSKSKFHKYLPTHDDNLLNKVLKS